VVSQVEAVNVAIVRHCWKQSIPLYNAIYT